MSGYVPAHWYAVWKSYQRPFVGKPLRQSSVLRDGSRHRDRRLSGIGQLHWDFPLDFDCFGLFGAT